MQTVIPVVLAGGTGSRLWPLSRVDFPKPFVTLPRGVGTLFEKTIQRALKIPGVNDLVVVSNVAYASLVKQCLSKVDTSTKIKCLWEPESRNTAPAILLAAEYISRNYGNDVILLVLPADHYILDTHSFVSSVQQAIECAKSGKLVSIGVEPTRPETGYGYILHEGNKVNQFIEKPDINTASRLIESENVLWNAGIFCFAVNSIIAEFEKHEPQILRNIRALSINENNNEIGIDKSDYGKLRAVSIDFAIMEKSKNLSVVSGFFDWSDVGSWGTFKNLYPVDGTTSNHVTGNVLCKDAKNNLVVAGERPVVVLGVNDLIVVQTEGATLVTNKSYEQEVKSVVGSEIIKNNVYEKVQRPWGSYQVIDVGLGYKVKRIEVSPGGMLSLQIHKHRAEHWTIVSGEALVTKGAETFKLVANESIFIKKSEVHRLQNISKEMCILIEVQHGDYLGEDDIIRLEDIYHRK